MTLYNVANYGAVGDGETNDARAIQEAINACFENGGGKVVLPAGRVYYSGSVELKAKVELHIETGAVLKASSNLEDYIKPLRPDGTQSTKATYKGRAIYTLVYALNADNITISGRGTIDGNCETFIDEVTQYLVTGKDYPRPTLVYLEKCNHLTVTGITLKNAPFWTLHPAGCDDVMINGIRILNSLKMANSDGIDPDHCTNVLISNCHIECADDCIVFKNTAEMAEYGPCQNIVVIGCTLISTSAAIKIGTESVNDFRNIVVDSCVITGSNRGIALQIRDGGNVENVLFSNIVIQTRRFYEGWWGKAEPIYVTSFDRDSNTKSGQIKNVYFSNISCKSENGIFISGWENNLLEDIVLENIRLEIVKQSKWDGGVYDRRPCAIEGLIYRKNAGIFCEHAKDVSIRNVKITWGRDIPEYYGAALEMHNVIDADIVNFRGKAASKDIPDQIIG